MIRTAAKLGAFVAVCLGFTLWLAFTIGNITLFQHTYRLSAAFDDVTGLLPDDNVKVAGVVVGKVRSIKVVDGRAVVSFSVHDDIKLPADSAASVRWRNLLGQRYVYLLPGEASTVLEDGDHVAETRSVVDLGQLFNRLGPIVSAIEPEKVNQFLDTVVAALDGNEIELRRAIDNLATLTDTLAKRDDAIARLVGNLDTVAATITSREQQIRTMLDNLVVIARTFGANTDVLDEAIVELGDFSDHLATLLENNDVEVDRIIDSLDIIAASVQRKLGTVDHLVAGLDEGAKRLFTASRFGTWLNQIIPCGSIGPLPVDASCDPEPLVGGDTNTSARGAAAIAGVLGAER